VKKSPSYFIDSQAYMGLYDDPVRTVKPYFIIVAIMIFVVGVL